MKNKYHKKNRNNNKIVINRIPIIIKQAQDEEHAHIEKRDDWYSQEQAKIESHCQEHRRYQEIQIKQEKFHRWWRSLSSWAQRTQRCHRAPGDADNKIVLIMIFIPQNQ